MTTATVQAPTTRPQPAGADVFGPISPAQVQAWLKSGTCVLIDVRERDEFDRERIEGSHLVPLSTFDPARVASLTKPGLPVVLHCKAGRRSADALQRCSALAASGVTLLNLPGGIDAWKASGLPVSPGREATAIPAAPKVGFSVMRQTQLIIGLTTLGGTIAGWLAHPGFLAIPAFMGAGLVLAGATGNCALATLVARLPWNKSTCDACKA